MMITAMITVNFCIVFYMIQIFFTSTSGVPSVNRTDLQALTLAGSSKMNSQLTGLSSARGCDTRFFPGRTHYGLRLASIFIHF